MGQETKRLTSKPASLNGSSRCLRHRAICRLLQIALGRRLQWLAELVPNEY